jgi:hypothetical protein
VEVMEAATPAAGEFLEVLAVFVAVVGFWFGLGFHGVDTLITFDRVPHERNFRGSTHSDLFGVKYF